MGGSVERMTSSWTLDYNESSGKLYQQARSVASFEIRNDPKLKYYSYTREG